MAASTAGSIGAFEGKVWDQGKKDLGCFRNHGSSIESITAPTEVVSLVLAPLPDWSPMMAWSWTKEVLRNLADLSDLECQDFDKDLRPCFPQSFRYVEFLGQYWHRNIPSPLAAPFLFLFMFVTWIQLTKLDPHRALFILVPGASMCSCHEVTPDDALGADELKAAAGVSGLQDWVATLSHRWESLHLSCVSSCFIHSSLFFTSGKSTKAACGCWW